MLKFLILIMMRCRLRCVVKIFIVMLRIVISSMFRRFKFERFLFKHLLLVVARPLHCLLMNSWIGIINWWVPCGHWLSVDCKLLLARLLGGVALVHHGRVVVVLHRHAPAVDLLGDDALGSGDHGYHGLVRH